MARRDKPSAIGTELDGKDLAIVPLLLLVTLIAPTGEDMTLGGNVIAVAIGIAAMVAVVGISASSRADLLAELDRLGTNLLEVQPGNDPFGEEATLPTTAPAMIRRIGPVESAAATRTVEIAAGTIEAGTVAGQRTIVTGMRGGRPLLRFLATWYCTTELDRDWDLGETGWRVTVEGDAPLNVDLRFGIPLERMAETSPGYTANRAVNAVPVVCAAPPGIRTTVDLPQVIAALG